MAETIKEYDVLIAGGGPAGLSALLWCADLGLSAVLFEKEPEFGGQLLHTYNRVSNYLGINAANGLQLRDTFLEHLANTGSKRLSSAGITRADLTDRAVVLASGERYAGRAIFIATGVRRRKLGVPGEDEFRDRGILISGVKHKEEVRGKTVVIVGGGDAALENALLLSQTAAKVIVLHRRDQFSARKEFIDRARKCKNIDFVPNVQVTAIAGKESVEAVDLLHPTSGMRSRIKTNSVLIRIGVEPNTGLFREQIVLDEKGYIVIDVNCLTSQHGIYAGGDVTNSTAPTISTAVGHGAVAIKSILNEMNGR